MCINFNMKDNNIDWVHFLKLIQQAKQMIFPFVWLCRRQYGLVLFSSGGDWIIEILANEKVAKQRANERTQNKKWQRATSWIENYRVARDSETTNDDDGDNNNTRKYSKVVSQKWMRTKQRRWKRKRNVTKLTRIRNGNKKANEIEFQPFCSRSLN